MRFGIDSCKYLNPTSLVHRVGGPEQLVRLGALCATSGWSNVDSP